MELSQQKCVPCEGGATPLTHNEIEVLLKEVHGWEYDNKVIFKQFKFNDFVECINFVNTVAHIAEEEGHHPDFHISYNKVRFELWTHAINGLSKNDFIMASKIDQAKKEFLD